MHSALSATYPTTNSATIARATDNPLKGVQLYVLNFGEEETELLKASIAKEVLLLLVSWIELIAEITGFSTDSLAVEQFLNILTDIKYPYVAKILTIFRVNNTINKKISQ